MGVVRIVLALSTLAVVLAVDHIDHKQWVDWIKACDNKTPEIEIRNRFKTESSKNSGDDKMYQWIPIEATRILSKKPDPNKTPSDDEDLARRLKAEITSPTTDDISDAKITGLLKKITADKTNKVTHRPTKKGYLRN